MISEQQADEIRQGLKDGLSGPVLRKWLGQLLDDREERMTERSMPIAVVGAQFELRPEKEGYLVHPELLKLIPRLVVATQSRAVRGLTARLYVHSLDRRGVESITNEARQHLDTVPPSSIAGVTQPRWSSVPACVRTGAAVDLQPFKEHELKFGGSAYLPYVPDRLRTGAVVSEFLRTAEEQALERGSLSGLTVFSAAIHVAADEGLDAWWQLDAFYDAIGRTEVRKLEERSRPVVTGI